MNKAICNKRLGREVFFGVRTSFAKEDPASQTNLAKLRGSGPVLAEILPDEKPPVRRKLLNAVRFSDKTSRRVFDSCLHPALEQSMRAPTVACTSLAMIFVFAT